MVDGHFTIVTEMWIESFQNRMRFEMGDSSLVIDGRVDPATRLTGSLHHQVFTILNLNIRFQRVRPADHANLALAADCPAEVLQSFLLQ